MPCRRAATATAPGRASTRSPSRRRRIRPPRPRRTSRKASGKRTRATVVPKEFMSKAANAAKNLIPPGYGDVRSTNLTAEVKEQSNSIDFKLSDADAPRTRRPPGKAGVSNHRWLGPTLPHQPSLTDNPGESSPRPSDDPRGPPRREIEPHGDDRHPDRPRRQRPKDDDRGVPRPGRTSMSAGRERLGEDRGQGVNGSRKACDQQVIGLQLPSVVARPAPGRSQLSALAPRGGRGGRGGSRRSPPRRSA